MKGKSENRNGFRQKLYELFQRSGPIQAGMWDNADGIEKSTVSENFIKASREKVKQLMERPLGELRQFAVLIDRTSFKEVLRSTRDCSAPSASGSQPKARPSIERLRKLTPHGVNAAFRASQRNESSL